MSNLDVESKALQYAEGQWDIVLRRITSPIARSFAVGLKEQIVDMLRQAYLAGARQQVGG